MLYIYKMNCDQIIYLGIFAIVAIYLYQNVLTPQTEGFTVSANMPFNGNSNAHAANAHAAANAAANANAQAANAKAAAANANAVAANAAQRASNANAAAAFSSRLPPHKTLKPVDNSVKSTTPSSD